VSSHLRRTVFACILAGLAACTAEKEVPTFTNPFDEQNGQGLPVPDSVTVQVGSNMVCLRWRVPEDAGIDAFGVFRRRIDTPSPEQERLIATVDSPSYCDFGVQNGRAYAYRIAAVRNGQFGPRSEAVDARPGVYSIVINNGARYTRSTLVSVTLNAPDAEQVRFTEDPNSPANEWLPVLPVVTNVPLSPGDGEKTLYAFFQLAGGAESKAIDTIVLDTKAVIDSVGFEGLDVRAPGSTVHFYLDSGEPDGAAFVNVAGLFTSPQRLFDDGTNGDVNGDGVYEGDVQLPPGPTVNSAILTGSFVDAAGNSTSLASSRTLSMRAAPDAVELQAFVAESSDPPSVTLNWTESRATDFAAYQVFRSEAAPGNTTPRPLTAKLTSKTTLEFRDSNVVEGKAYAYYVSVWTTGLMQTPSNIVDVPVPNVRPPFAVTLNPADVGETTVSLRWSRSADRDFAQYQLRRRNETGGVTVTDPLVATITNPDSFFWDDRNLVENTDYFYKVWVVDTAGRVSPPSSEIKATTRNKAPDAVSLAEATGDSMSATLSWTRSSAHDFAEYRLYRAEGTGVTEASTLVVTIEEPDVIRYKDRGLTPATTYYYRVYVVDTGSDSLSTGSNEIDFTTPD
jgi:fibronectin type 3 domain-containing protein